VHFASDGSDVFASEKDTVGAIDCDWVVRMPRSRG
jgi:hypothetical protein